MTDEKASPPGRRGVTLTDIARLVNVSPATVSNAYNRPDQLSSALRERILQTARELDYSGPHPAARSLRRGVAASIGVVLTEKLSYAFSDSAAIHFLRGLSMATEAVGMSLLLMPASPRGDSAAVRDAIVDGFIVYSMPDNHPDVEAIIARRLPTVFVDSPRVMGMNFVGVDDRTASRQVADHLLALGHRRVAIVSFALKSDGFRGRAGQERQDSAHRFVTRERLAGYREAIEARGMAWQGVRVEECTSSQQAEGLAAGLAILGDEPRPTAIIAMSDLLALGVLEAAGRLGINAPGELGIVGFDDIPAAATSEPSLTTIHQPLTEKGLVAGELVFASFESGRSVRQGYERVLPTNLVVRASGGHSIRPT
jgi:DNA-binding LacI/PurR family transcriptional regulator